MHFFMRAVVCNLLIGTFVVLSGTVQANSSAQEASQARSISETIQFALTNHPRIRSQQTVVGLEAARLGQVESEFLPHVSLALGVGREDSNNASTRVLTGKGSNEMERREASVAVSQMLFDGFKTHWQRKSQLDEMSAADWDFKHISNEVALKAVESHLALSKSNKVLNFNLNNLKAHQAIAKNISLRVRSGKDDQAKVSQVNARMALSRANVEVARNNVMQAISDYWRQVGVGPGVKLHFQSHLFRLPDSRVELVDGVVQSNPLINALIKRKRSLLSTAKAENNVDFPTLHLESGASWNANLDGVEGRSSDAFIMLRMRYDLFQGGADKAARKQASLINQSAGYKLDDARREVRRDAEQVWHRYQSSANRISFLHDYVESALDTLIAYKKQFNIGQRSLIDLLDAENELLRSELQLVDAKKELYLSKYQILNLQGRLIDMLGSTGIGFDND